MATTTAELRPSEIGHFIPMGTGKRAVQWNGFNAYEIVRLTNCDKMKRLTTDDGNLAIVVHVHCAYTHVSLGEWILVGVDGIPSTMTDNDFRRAYKRVELVCDV